MEIRVPMKADTLEVQLKRESDWDSISQECQTRFSGGGEQYKGHGMQLQGAESSHHCTAARRSTSEKRVRGDHRV